MAAWLYLCNTECQQKTWDKVQLFHTWQTQQTSTNVSLYRIQTFPHIKHCSNLITSYKSQSADIHVGKLKEDCLLKTGEGVVDVSLFSYKHH